MFINVVSPEIYIHLLSLIRICYDCVPVINFKLFLLSAAKVRRLYDIANVLACLKLIEKVQVSGDGRYKKPAFQYIGPSPQSLQAPSTGRPNILSFV